MTDASAEAPPRAEAPSSAPAPSGRAHLHDVDVVRFTTVLGVIAVHSTSLLLPDTEVSGAALAVMHVTREVFLFLSAFVLGYSSRLPIELRRFWRRRFPLVLAPYLVWSAIYVVSHGDLVGPGTTIARYARDILSGGASFHLYFLLLTLQLYLIFPWMRAWLGRCSHHGRILLGVLVWQVAFTSAIWFRADLPGVNVWLTHPGTWLPSYVLYVVAGVLAALHFDEVRAWTAAHRQLIAWSALVVLAGGVSAYELDVHALHESYLHASEVFSPIVVIESCAAIGAQFALGLWVAGWAGPRLRRFLRTSSDLSFGVYLAHPLLIEAFVDVLSACGQHGLAGLPSGVGLLLVIGVIVPVAWVITGGAAWLVRRTPLSLALTGRRQLAPQPVPSLA